MTPENKKILEELKNTHYGVALNEFLKEKYNYIGDITTIKSWDETLGRQYAVKVIKELFSFMEEQKAQIQNKNQYK